MFKRKSLIVFYNNNQALSTLESLNVNLVYKSERLSYAVIYFDEERTKQIFGTLNNNSHITGISESKTSMEHMFF
ncbi:MAG: DUF2129 domain-containing protein [Erysipelotrichales bacterium]|nr:DUF2129 domain-containing protein [Erysipelotrichales bacterium]